MQALLRKTICPPILRNTPNTMRLASPVSILRRSHFLFVARTLNSSSVNSATAAAAPKKMHAAEAFMNGPSASYIEEMYMAWLQNPASVHVSWQVYFRNMLSSGHHPAFIPPPNIIPTAASNLSYEGVESPTDVAENLPAYIPADEIMEHMKVQLLVRAYQVRGHHLAKIDPLEINVSEISLAPELDYTHYGFGEADLDRKFYLGSGILPGFLAHENRRTITLREIIDRLQKTYCGPIGIEYGHIPDRLQCDWLRQKFEVPARYTYTREQKLVILDRLLWSDTFERFVASKYPTEKRFGLEGCESLVPGMKALIDTSVEFGVNSIVMGMAHRGRLNVLSNVVRKPNESIFAEFAGSNNSDEYSGDVKYHLGMNYVRPTPSGKMVHLSLVANPSHLEAANPVVEGKVRGTQFYQNDEKERGKAMAVLLHGDAAFSGQGVVYETLGFSDLPGYTTGGTINIVINNQIGFTTDPRFSRSTPYCSDVAKTVSAPILHVNGDDVEAVVFAMELAAEWRAKFKKDVVLDIVCYRKYGHNEIDQPQFTQPLMYKKIAQMKPVAEKYVTQLLEEGSVTQEEVDAMKSRIWDILEQSYKLSTEYTPSPKEWVSSSWTGFKSPMELSAETVPSKATGVEEELLKHIGLAACSFPSDLQVHNNLGKILKAREKSIKDGNGIDWATAESMAFGSLLAEGIHVRLSGQDVERGTFSQRHSVLHDQNTERQYVPLNNLVVASLVPSQSPFTVCNSSLSEFGTLGFELGYSLVHPNQLVMWEAQFGDFANNAQCIIDQFICSGEQKWLQQSGLTMLLPHGYDGQGPEHSSARIERFLQLVDEDPYLMPDLESAEKGSYARQHQDCNMQVVYPTVPSNYFHVLRRQVHREFRKPLIAFVSKSLLRHPLARSSLQEMVSGTRFQRLIPEVLHKTPLDGLKIAQVVSDGSLWADNNVEPRIPYPLASNIDAPLHISSSAPNPVTSTSQFSINPPNEITTLVFCSGQVYYALYKARELNNLKHIAIVRVEQLSPFPFWECKQVIDFYGSSLKEIVWAQEESLNSGAWLHVEPRLTTAIKNTDWYKSPLAQQWASELQEKANPGGLGLARKHLAAGNGEFVSFRGSAMVRFAGRDQSAAPATGLKKQHYFEEYALVAEALLGGNICKPKRMHQGTPVFFE